MTDQKTDIDLASKTSVTQKITVAFLMAGALTGAYGIMLGLSTIKVKPTPPSVAPTAEVIPAEPFVVEDIKFAAIAIEGKDEEEIKLQGNLEEGLFLDLGTITEDNVFVDGEAKPDEMNLSLYLARALESDVSHPSMMLSVRTESFQGSVCVPEAEHTTSDGTRYFVGINGNIYSDENLTNKINTEDCVDVLARSLKPNHITDVKMSVRFYNLSERFQIDNRGNSAGDSYYYKWDPTGNPLQDAELPLSISQYQDTNYAADLVGIANRVFTVDYSKYTGLINSGEQGLGYNYRGIDFGMMLSSLKFLKESDKNSKSSYQLERKLREKMLNKILKISSIILEMEKLFYNVFLYRISGNDKRYRDYKMTYQYKLQT